MKQEKTLEQKLAKMYVESLIWWLFLVFAIGLGMNIYYAWKVIKAILNFLG
jgi:hypothetical protein